MLSYKEFINEHQYSLGKKESPLLVTKSQTISVPIEGCCVIILSKPYPDKLKRVFMGIIDKVINEKKVIFIPQYFCVKEYPNGKIWYEKVNLGLDGRKKYLNMSTDALVLNQNKTPLWEESSQLNKEKFFTQYQDKLKELLNRDDIFIFKSTKPKPI